MKLSFGLLALLSPTEAIDKYLHFAIGHCRENVRNAQSCMAMCRHDSLCMTWTFYYPIRKWAGNSQQKDDGKAPSNCYLKGFHHNDEGRYGDHYGAAQLPDELKDLGVRTFGGRCPHGRCPRWRDMGGPPTSNIFFAYSGQASSQWADVDNNAPICSEFVEP